MKTSALISSFAAVTGIVLASSIFAPAQAAVLGGNPIGDPTCDNDTVSFAYIDCAGYFEGNSTGDQGTALANLNSLFGGNWSMLSDLESPPGQEGPLDGTVATSFRGPGAIAIKAGDSYSLYTIADLSSFEWSTGGVMPVGSGNQPGLSHLSIYRNDVPEPLTILGTALALGFGGVFKKQQDKKRQ